jgi:putative membrane protein
MQDRGRGGGEGVRTRDHMANMRTTLVWIRTGMFLMAVGYGTDKVGVLYTLYGVPSALVSYGHVLGLLAVGGGICLTAAALPRYLWQRRRIESPTFVPRPWADLALLLALGLGGLALLIVLVVAR